MRQADGEHRGRVEAAQLREVAEVVAEMKVRQVPVVGDAVQRGGYREQRGGQPIGRNEERLAHDARAPSHQSFIVPQPFWRAMRTFHMKPARRAWAIRRIFARVVQNRTPVRLQSGSFAGRRPVAACAHPRIQHETKHEKHPRETDALQLARDLLPLGRLPAGGAGLPTIEIRGPKGSDSRVFWMNVHLTAGTLVLVLRVLWRAVSRVPPPIPQRRCCAGCRSSRMSRSTCSSSRSRCSAS